jgi:transmembrane sensor
MTEFDRLFCDIAREEDVLLSAGHRLAQVRRRVMWGSPPRRVTERALLMPLASAVTLTLVVAGAALAWQSRVAASITAEFGESGAQVQNGTWLTAPETSSVPLRFSDGTQIQVAPQSRMRLIELRRNGAQLALESGRADVNVAHGDNRRWELRAGPFTVRVTGTRFDLSWHPNDDSFELILNEGQVELVGCGFGAGRKLVAGQRVHASCRESKVEIAYSHDAKLSETASLAAVDAPLAAPNVGRDSGSVGNCSSAMPEDVIPAAVESAGLSSSNIPRAEVTKVDWITLARSGKYAAALAAANRLGFSAECTRTRADELLLLGDVARHAGEADKARIAYTQLRQRFPGTKSASLAAFSIGVLEFDQSGAYARAANWFRTYLRESPTGPLTREARGRLMEALQRTGGDEASSVARDYLRDYPSGPHARLAQRIISSR